MWKNINAFFFFNGKKLINPYSCRSLSMVNFNSIIVFDIETTGLPHLESNNTKIIELALLGCETEHLTNATDLPRVLHKLILLFNPMKMISPVSSEMTGLENESLVNIKPFSENDIQTLRNFIERLPSPVCIVSHNGNRFDFPILQKHIQKLNLTLPSTFYCADSLQAFQDLYPVPAQYAKEKLRNHSKFKINEITPLQKLVLNKYSRKSNDRGTSVLSNVSKELFPEDSDDEVKIVYSSIDEKSNKIAEKKKASAPVNYKLSNIYEFLHGKNLKGAHRAEDDALALLSCIIKCDQFIDWMNKNAVPFNNIKPLL